MPDFNIVWLSGEGTGFGLEHAYRADDVRAAMKYASGLVRRDAEPLGARGFYVEAASAEQSAFLDAVGPEG